MNHQPPANHAPALLALALGNFAIGTGVLIVAGMLSELASGLGVSVPVAGQLIAAGAAVICLGAPLAAGFTSSIDRRALLSLSLGWYALGLALSALAGGYAQLLGLRVLTVISAAVFSPQAAATAALMVPPERRGRAIAFVFLGWSIASVAGMPLGAWVAGRFGWRVGFGAAGALAALASAAVAATLPKGLRTAPLTRASWAAVLTHPLLPLLLLVTAAHSTGQFAVFSYIAPYLEWLLQADSGRRAMLLAWLGAFGVLGNALVARRIDRLGPDRVVAWTLLAIAAGIALLPLGRGSVPVAAVALMVWGLGIFGVNSAQQARLAGGAPRLTPASIALNTSCIYVGQATGTALGGLLLARSGIAPLTWFGAAVVVLAMGLSAAASRRCPTMG